METLRYCFQALGDNIMAYLGLFGPYTVIERFPQWTRDTGALTLKHALYLAAKSEADSVVILKWGKLVALRGGKGL